MSHFNTNKKKAEKRGLSSECNPFNNRFDTHLGDGFGKKRYQVSIWISGSSKGTARRFPPVSVMRFDNSELSIQIVVLYAGSKRQQIRAGSLLQERDKLRPRGFTALQQCLLPDHNKERHPRQLHLRSKALHIDHEQCVS
jgi:hypothetical protein